MTSKEINSPVTSSLKAAGQFVDNAISQSLKRLSFKGILRKTGVRKKFGAEAGDILYIILLAPIVRVNSTWAFCEKFLEQWRIGAKDVIYRFLRREDINWASIQMSLAITFARIHLVFVPKEDCAIVADCSKRHRSGKVEGASHLFDHVISKVVRSQQVIAIGLATPKGFIPLANHFCIGKKKRQERTKGFDDGRSEVAKAWKRACDESPALILKAMVKRAIAAGIKAKWLIADSGYGMKANIALALDHGLDALFLMKRDRTNYRIDGRLYKAKELYKLFRRRMKPVAGGCFRSVAFNAEINLKTNKDQLDRWVPVQLMLSRPTRNWNKNGWVLSLCTDMDVSVERMIELYLMRWSIEVFFKECKQHLGWLNNQSGDFVSSYASMHLSSIRYLLLLDAALNADSGEAGLVAIRREASEHLNLHAYMGILWQWFVRLIFGWLDDLEHQLDKSVLGQIKVHLEGKVDEFIDLAFQIDINSLETQPVVDG